MKSGTKENDRRFLDPTVGLFVSLYFILMAFFIVMNTLSNQETARAAAVVASLERAFERPFETPAQASGLIPPGRHIVSDDAFLEDVGTLIAAWQVPVTHYASRGGNVVRFKIRASRLFYVDDARMSAQALSLLSRLAALVEAAPAGMKRDITFIFGQEGRAGSFAFRRADALARTALRAGMPESTLVVGLDQTQSGQMIALEMRSTPFIGEREIAR